MDISVDNVMEQKSERGKIHESWFVMLELLTKATQTKAFVLSAFFIMGQSLCWKVEKALETTLLTVKNIFTELVMASSISFTMCLMYSSIFSLWCSTLSFTFYITYHFWGPDICKARIKTLRAEAVAAHRTDPKLWHRAYSCFVHRCCWHKLKSVTYTHPSSPCSSKMYFEKNVPHLSKKNTGPSPVLDVPPLFCTTPLIDNEQSKSKPNPLLIFSTG